MATTRAEGRSHRAIGLALGSISRVGCLSGSDVCLFIVRLLALCRSGGYSSGCFSDLDAAFRFPIAEELEAKYSTVHSLGFRYSGSGAFRFLLPGENCSVGMG